MNSRIDLQAFYCPECCQFNVCSHLQSLYEDETSHLRSICDTIREKISNSGVVFFSNVPRFTSFSENEQTLKEFFRLPLDIKSRAISKDKARRGYSGISTENFASLIGTAGKPNDLVEKFRVGPIVDSTSKEQCPEYYSTKEGRIHYFANDFSSLSNGFQLFLISYFQQMETLSNLILSIFELSCGLPLHSLSHCEPGKSHTSILSFNCFPKLNGSSAASVTGSPLERIADHVDVSVFTIVAEVCSSSEKSLNCELQFLNETNEWETIQFEENGVVVNIGECFQYRSEGLLKPARHRVIEKVNEERAIEERLTSAYFYTPNYDQLLDWPMDSSVPISSLETAPLTYSEWRRQCIAKAVKSLKR
jgi:isopenicillin N synthase-like dioxygenase